jgi:hypothetical protein
MEKWKQKYLKAEDRTPKEALQADRRIVRPRPRSVVLAFGLRISFGIRPSDFGFCNWRSFDNPFDAWPVY